MASSVIQQSPALCSMDLETVRSKLVGHRDSLSLTSLLPPRNYSMTKVPTDWGGRGWEYSALNACSTVGTTYPLSDSNRDALRQEDLNLPCLPIPPRGLRRAKFPVCPRLLGPTSDLPRKSAVSNYIIQRGE